MSTGWAKIVSRAILLGIVAMLATQIVLHVTGGDRIVSEEIVVVGDPQAPGVAEVRADLEGELALGARFGGTTLLEVFIFGTVAVVWGITGSLIVSRQPRNTAGWIFCLTASAVALSGFSFAYTLYGVRIARSPLPAQDAVTVVGEHALWAWALIPLLVLLFPDGRPPSRRWRWAEWILLAGFATAIVVFALTPGPLNNLVESGILYVNPIGVDAFAEGRPINALVPAGTLMALGASLSTVVAVRQRYRLARGEERQQMRWLVAVATLAGLGIGSLFLMFPISALLGIEEGGSAVADAVLGTLFMLTAASIFLGIPAAYLVAIFKHGLWELDVVVRKALLALALTLLMVLVGLLILGVLGQSAFWTGTSRSVAVFMGIVAGVLLWPLARVSNRVARRAVFGRRAAPYEVLTEFSGRVGETYATEDVLPRMAQILGEGTGASRARVWLHVGGELRPAAAWPDGAPAVTPLPLGSEDLTAIAGETAVGVRDRGELLGALSVSMPASDPMNPAKERLIRDLASQAGLVLRNVRLIEELRASRQRLVAAQDEERRRIERNLHDGAQQQLVALSVQLKLARSMVDRDPARAGEMLDQVQASASDALEELRDLARGIYPPLLADQGLPAALEAQARKAVVPTTVDPDGVGRYPQEIEAAVYFCTLEALSNVAKYAQASHVAVRLADERGVLVFEVADDGIGFDPSTTGHGTGLQGMADRLEAIGGELEVRAASGSGTTVRGRIPTGGGGTRG